MSDKSLFQKHWNLISQDPATWTPEEKAESEHLNSLRLPPLEDRRRWYKKPLLQKVSWQIGLITAATLSLVLMIHSPRKESLSAKGSMQISVFWSRAGRVAPLTENSQLQDGDKVGASVVSSEDAIAYWAITDSNLKVISEQSDIEASKLHLTPGESKNFSSSFTLVAPNQGENLVVVVCPKASENTHTKLIDPIFNREFVSKLFLEQKMKSEGCTFAGFRLRRAP